MVLVKCVEWKGKLSESSEVGFVELWGGGIDRTDRSRFLGGGEVLFRVLYRVEKEAVDRDEFGQFRKHNMMIGGGLTDSFSRV